MKNDHHPDGDSIQCAGRKLLQDIPACVEGKRKDDLFGHPERQSYKKNE